MSRKVKEIIATIASVLIDYIHSPHEEISTVISTLKKLDEIPFPSSPPGEKHDRVEELREARLFAGMEMTVDFDLTRWNLITLRTGTCSNGTRNEACRRSRVDDGDVKVRYEIHRRSFSSEGEISLFLLDLVSYVWRQTRHVYICRITLTKTMGLAPISRCAIRLDDSTVRIIVYVC